MRHIFCELYEANLYFCLGWSEKRFIKEMKERWDDDLETLHGCDGNTQEHVAPDGSQLIFIWVRDKKDIATLVHECLHATHMILHARGVKPCFVNDETTAYLLDFIVRKALK